MLVTAYFIYFKDYLFFIRDTAYRSIIWDSEGSFDFDSDEMDNFLKKNYSTPAVFISKIFFIFVSPFFLLYVLFYIIKKMS
jgi:hypothetical protein